MPIPQTPLYRINNLLLATIKLSCEKDIGVSEQFFEFIYRYQFWGRAVKLGITQVPFF